MVARSAAGLVFGIQARAIDGQYLSYLVVPLMRREVKCCPPSIISRHYIGPFLNKDFGHLCVAS